MLIINYVLIGEWTPNYKAKPADISCENALNGGCCGRCLDEYEETKKSNGENGEKSNGEVHEI